MNRSVPIEWAGNLARDERIDGFIGGVRVASIAPKDGKLTVATTNGLQYATHPAKSIKEAKVIAEEGFRDFLLTVGARFYTHEEFIFVQVLLEMATRRRLGQPGDDTAMWLRLAELWTEQRDENLARLDDITERVTQLRADVERHKEPAAR